MLKENKIIKKKVSKYTLNYTILYLKNLKIILAYNSKIAFNI